MNGRARCERGELSTVLCDAPLSISITPEPFVFPPHPPRWVVAARPPLPPCLPGLRWRRMTTTTPHPEGVACRTQWRTSAPAPSSCNSACRGKPSRPWAPSSRPPSLRSSRQRGGVRRSSLKSIAQSWTRSGRRCSQRQKPGERRGAAARRGRRRKKRTRGGPGSGRGSGGGGTAGGAQSARAGPRLGTGGGAGTSGGTAGARAGHGRGHGTTSTGVIHGRGRGVGGGRGRGRGRGRDRRSGRGHGEGVFKCLRYSLATIATRIAQALQLTRHSHESA